MLLFAVKHTQDRQQTALQLKLDELILSIACGRRPLVQIERADEKELVERKHDQIAEHETLRGAPRCRQRDERSSLRCQDFAATQFRSNRSRFITLFHAATKSCTNFSCASSLA